MKSELRLVPHSMMDAQAVEVWHDGNFIATVYGADGPGVRVVSKYPMTVNGNAASGINPLSVVEVLVQ